MAVKLCANSSNVVTRDARIFSKRHPSDVFESNAAMLTKASSMTVWNHLGRDPSPGPSRLWHKSPCSCFGAEKNRFILARLPIFSRRLPVGRPWYYSVSTLVVACAKQEMIIGVSAQHSLILDWIKCFAPVSIKKSTLRTLEHALCGDAFTLLGQKSISRLKTKPIRCEAVASTRLC